MDSILYKNKTEQNVFFRSILIRAQSSLGGASLEALEPGGYGEALRPVEGQASPSSKSLYSVRVPRRRQKRESKVKTGSVKETLHVSGAEVLAGGKAPCRRKAAESR